MPNDPVIREPDKNRRDCARKLRAVDASHRASAVFMLQMMGVLPGEDDETQG